jgi:spore germination protein KA
MEDAVDRILDGGVILFADGSDKSLHFEAKLLPARSIERPTSEVTVLGPQVGFTESIRDNIALVRARIKSSDLMVERVVIGRKSRTDVRILYLRGIARKRSCARSDGVFN